MLPDPTLSLTTRDHATYPSIFWTYLYIVLDPPPRRRFIPPRFQLRLKRSPEIWHRSPKGGAGERAAIKGGKVSQICSTPDQGLNSIGY